jgi:hypothetical protein
MVNLDLESFDSATKTLASTTTKANLRMGRG